MQSTYKTYDTDQLNMLLDRYINLSKEIKATEQEIMAKGITPTTFSFILRQRENKLDAIFKLENKEH